MSKFIPGLRSAAAATSALVAAASVGAPLPVAMERARARSGMGLIIRADAQDPEAMFAALRRDVEAMRATFESNLNGRSTPEEVNALITPINENITNLTSALAAIQARVDAGIGPDGGGVIGELPGNPEYVAAFRGMMRNGNDAQLQEVAAAAARANPQAAMSIGSAPDGGYLAPVEWDRSITDQIRQDSPIRANSEVITITGQGFTRLFSTGAPGSGWVGETAARPQTTTPTLAPLTFNVGEIYANPAITQQALDDAAINLETWLGDQVRAEFSRQENIAFLSGNGTNKPYGLLTYITGAANEALHPLGDIEVSEAAGPANITADDFISLLYAVRSEAVTTNSKWFMNRATIGQIRLLKDLNDNYIWQPALTAESPQSLLGEPIVEVPGMALPAASAVVALYGDMRRTYLVIDRVGIRVLRDPFTNKPYVMFYTTKRVGGGVQNPEYMRALKMAAA